MLGEFKAFLTKSNALALAIGIIIGIALGAVVNSMVKDLIMPPIAALLGGVDFSSLKIVLKAATNPADPTTEVAIRWGSFILTVVQFVVISAVVFLIAKVLIKEEPAAPAEPSDEVKLLTDIRDALRKG
jgi:large conductance mechanosensitive channel